MTTTTTDKSPASVESSFVTRNGRQLYEIRGLDRMPPFLMTVVGDSDLWMYLSSAGAFTAGRVEPDRCILPYETDDRLHELAGLQGPVTLVRFEDGRLWRPFDRRPGPSTCSRILRRSAVGDLVEFEETDTDTGSMVCVRYALVDALGVVRRVTVELPEHAQPIRATVLDGYRNIMPASVPLVLQQQMSNLVDAYKRSELLGARGPAIYALEAAISDSPQPKEALRGNTVWHMGLADARVLLDDAAAEAFERGAPHETAQVVTGRRGAYLCEAELRLSPGESSTWVIVADADIDQPAAARIRQGLERGEISIETIDEAIEREHARLRDLLFDADACQATNDPAAAAAHQSNVLFNLMRGGVPIDGHRVCTEDFRRFVRLRHRGVAARNESPLGSLGASVSMSELVEWAASSGDAQLLRLALEYLPLTFGRRHGDPSRPWNRFRIRVRDARGHRVTGYEGNWRDIFQNWEAVCRSYPAMLPGVVTKFLNATTADGYNPYRINEQGIDWEVPEPENPRSNIGYWGDHQIVYLHRLLERCGETHPAWLRSMAHEAVFSYADVPYRIRGFDEIAANPRESIRFDAQRDTKLRASMASIGGDGALLASADGEPVLVTLLEKLLVPALAKVANLVPDGGIWMNTQRPEWNDANNALAGYGLSMVTLYQLRHYADWCIDLIESLEPGRVCLSAAVAEWCQSTNDVLVQSLQVIGENGPIDDDARWSIMADLGMVAQNARDAIYRSGPGKPQEIDQQILVDFFRLTRFLCDHSIRNAKRSDGLYESYRVLHLGVSRAGVESLAPMLEGQVAVLAAGVLDETESIELLGTLFDSPLYREDQKTFLLYPYRDLPGFLGRNQIPAQALAASPLLAAAIERPELGLAVLDADGVARFDAELVSQDALRDRLSELARTPEIARLISEDKGRIAHAYEKTFAHARFTGRSSTMHKYEGLGSVYWHMVSKLLLAVQETVFRAADRHAPATQIDTLCAFYQRIRDGLGFRKSPQEFGAVPFEPYSHTPWAMGAQQPGMTGQVKEGVLARFGELGVRLDAGRLRFDPTLLDPAELLPEPASMPIGPTRVPVGGVGLTVCGVPVTLTEGPTQQVEVTRNDGSTERVDGLLLPERISRAVFDRDGSVRSIAVQFSSDR